MKNIYFFVSSFGFGHLTRTIAIIREILRTDSEYIVHLFAPKNQCDFFIKSINNEYKNRIRTYPISTDMGLYYEKGEISEIRGLLLKIKEEMEKIKKENKSIWFRKEQSLFHFEIVRINKNEIKMTIPSYLLTKTEVIASMSYDDIQIALSKI